MNHLQDFDEIILSSGVVPRIPDINGIHLDNVMTYQDAILKKKEVGERIAIIGAGGIGFDIATWLCHDYDAPVSRFYEEWGIDVSLKERGGLYPPELRPSKKTNFFITT